MAPSLLNETLETAERLELPSERWQVDASIGEAHEEYGEDGPSERAFGRRRWSSADWPPGGSTWASARGISRPRRRAASWRGPGRKRRSPTPAFATGFERTAPGPRHASARTHSFVFPCLFEGGRVGPDLRG